MLLVLAKAATGAVVEPTTLVLVIEQPFESVITTE
jgi:hypothetical protein